MRIGVHSSGVAEMVLSKMVGGVVEKEGFVGVERLASVEKAFILGGLLCLLQALDGILTSVGVSRFGIDIEGNPFVRSLMMELGHIPALSLIKCLAVVAIIALTFYARKIPWINNAMGAVSAVYIFSAIIPWTYILFVRPYLM